MTIFASILLVLALLLALWVFLVAPGRSSASQRAPFHDRLCAHRGLYQKDQTMPENSLPAFAAALCASGLTAEELEELREILREGTL